MFLKGSWASDTFVTNYLPFALFPILYIGAKFWYKDPIKRPEEMDFISGIKEIESESWDEPPPANVWEKFWAWLM